MLAETCTRRKAQRETTICFSPLAGIMLAETVSICIQKRVDLSFQSPCGDYVGGNMPIERDADEEINYKVSVPLRGLCWRKPGMELLMFTLLNCFSPLAGIMLAETEVG